MLRKLKLLPDLELTAILCGPFIKKVAQVEADIVELAEFIVKDVKLGTII